MKTTNKIHYVYKITNLTPTDERLYYIGVKSSFNPLTDNYMGSSKYLDESMKEIGRENFKKEVLSTWDTRKLAMQEEIRLHEEFDVACNEMFYNKAKQKSDGFDTTGMSFTNGEMTVNDTRVGSTKRVSTADYEKYDYYTSLTEGMMAVLDIRDNLSKHVSVEDYKNYDCYVSIMKGKLAVIDKRDGKTKRVTKEDYEKYDYYISTSTGTITVKDTRDNSMKIVSIEDFNNYNYYESIIKGMFAVKDTRDGKTKQVTVEDYNDFDYYISPSSKHYKVFNSQNTLIVETIGAFRKMCKEYKFPREPFLKSAINNVVIPTGRNKKFYGWYVTVE